MTKIKICGLFRPCDIDFVNEAKPDFIGFVFAKSRRQVSPTLANELRKKLHPSIIPVGVYAQKRIQQIKKNLAREHSISGSAVVPNLEEDAVWQEANQTIRMNFDQLLARAKDQFI